MVLEVFAVFGRVWIILLACFQASRPAPPTILPLASRSPAGARLKQKQNARAGTSTKDSDAQGLAQWQEQKQEFLRHPSLRRSKEGKLSIPDQGKREEKTSRFVPPTFKVHDWSYIPSADLRPPPRPPRPPSGPVPSVIVTPCTPIIAALPELSSSTAQISMLDAMEPTTPPESVSPEENAPESVDSATDCKAPATSPILEHDIAELKPDDVDNPFKAPDSIIPVETPRQSFNIPHSLKTISFGPLHYPANAVSSASDMLFDDLSWIYQTSPTDRLAARANSYVTSTPAKKRQGHSTNHRRQASGSPFSDANSPPSLRFPDDQMDLLPYPDVFDLDMYYGSESNRLSIPRHKQPAPSQARQPLKNINRASSSSSQNQTPKKIVSPKSDKRFGFVPEAQSTRNSSPTKSQEVKRYRDHYRHPAYTCPPHPSPDTSIDSLMGEAKIPKASRILTPTSAGNFNTLPVRSPTLPWSSRSAKATMPMTDIHLSPLKHRGVYPPPPIVVVSHHRFGSFSEASQPTDAEDSEELRARLREACDNFSKSVLTDVDESCSMEAVSLN